MFLGEQVLQQQKVQFISPNTVIKMFGGWLFEAGSRVEPGYEKARAKALGILCKVFSKARLGRKMAPEYCARFFLALSKGLESDPLSVASVLSNSEDLFLSDLDGFRALLPQYLSGIYRFQKQDEVAELPELLSTSRVRLSCIRILGHIAVISTTLGRIQLDSRVFAALDQEDVLFQQISDIFDQHVNLSSFNQLKKHVLHCLTQFLFLETSADNLKSLFQVFLAFTAETHRSSPQLMQFIIRVFSEKLFHATWSNDLTISGLALLSRYLDFYLALPSKERMEVNSCDLHAYVGEFNHCFQGWDCIPYAMMVICKLIEKRLKLDDPVVSHCKSQKTTTI